MSKTLRVRFYDDDKPYQYPLEVASSIIVVMPDDLGYDGAKSYITSELIIDIRNYVAEECAGHFFKKKGDLICQIQNGMYGQVKWLSGIKMEDT